MVPVEASLTSRGFTKALSWYYDPEGHAMQSNFVDSNLSFCFFEIGHFLVSVFITGVSSVLSILRKSCARVQ
ncbi:hypothetical protein M405DRAFT_108553 [Rhizopogon salebrosus TDB-379]|nr:hypothetical protein M405DRAFT_108553 [Rhizopogon salebrosus TDB-379]